MKDELGKLAYMLLNALGTISVYFIVTEGFEASYLVTLGISSVLSVLLPYEVKRKGNK